VSLPKSVLLKATPWLLSLSYSVWFACYNDIFASLTFCQDQTWKEKKKKKMKTIPTPAINTHDVYSMLALALPKHKRSNRSSGLIRNSYLLNKQMIIDNSWFFGYQDQREWLLTFGLGIMILQGVSSRKSLAGVVSRLMSECALPTSPDLPHARLKCRRNLLTASFY
jgi:hypothetical protein